MPANVTVEATGPMTPVTFAAATASDAVSGVASLTYTQASGSLFPVGVTTVSVTATDNRGNSVTKSFTVTVKDTTAPVITTTYANILLEATGVGTPVSYAAAVATDAVRRRLVQLFDAVRVAVPDRVDAGDGDGV